MGLFSDFIDRFVAAVSPQAGLQRQLARRLLEASRARQANGPPASGQLAHEGAETDRLRVNRWIGAYGSESDFVDADLPSLRARAREIFKNDGLGGAITTVRKNVVGHGGMLMARILPSERLDLDESRVDLMNDQLDAAWIDWSSRVNPGRDHSFAEVLGLVTNHLKVDGEAFVVLSDVGAADISLPLSVEVIDPARVETPPNQTKNGRIRHGIKKDASGRIVSYFVRRTSPEEMLRPENYYDEVPAERVMHVYDQLLAGQSRGWPWFQRVLNKSKDVHDLDEATHIAAYAQACYAGFVESAPGGFGSAAALGAGNGTPTATSRAEQDIIPGTLKYLNPGEKVTFGTPNHGVTYQPVQKWAHRRIAAGLDLPYEFVGKDWQGLSFAAGRLVLADARLSFEWDRNILRSKLIAPLWRRFVLECVLLGLVDLSASDYAAAPWHFCAHVWMAPAWPYAITPREEIGAAVDAVENNLATKTDKAAELGGDLRTIYAYREWEMKEERRRGIVPVKPGAAPVPAPPFAPAEDADNHEEVDV